MASWSPIARRIRVPMGFATAAAFLYLARPSYASLGIGVSFVVLGLLARAAASGHVRKNEQLTTSGPYAHTRNPLYLGSLIIAAGFVIASRSWMVALLIAFLFLAIYLPVIQSEEAFLRAKFPAFDNYARHVPRFLPRIKPFGNLEQRFSWHLYFQHREYNAALGSAALMGVLIAKLIWLSK